MPQLHSQLNTIFQGSPITAQPSFSQFGGPGISSGVPGAIGIAPPLGTGGPVQDPTGTTGAAPGQQPFPTTGLPTSPFSPGETDAFNRLGQRFGGGGFF